MPSSDLPVATLVINGKPVVIDQRVLTMRERQQARAAVAQLERELGDYKADDLDNLCSVIWVIMRRDDPDLTYEQVCDSITMASLADASASTAEETHPEA